MLSLAQVYQIVNTCPSSFCDFTPPSAPWPLLHATPCLLLVGPCGLFLAPSLILAHSQLQLCTGGSCSFLSWRPSQPFQGDVQPPPGLPPPPQLFFPALSLTLSLRGSLLLSFWIIPPFPEWAGSRKSSSLGPCTCTTLFLQLTMSLYAFLFTDDLLIFQGLLQTPLFLRSLS